MADDTKLDDTKPIDEVSAALDEAPADPVTESVSAEGDAGKPADEAPSDEAAEASEDLPAEGKSKGRSAEPEAPGALDATSTGGSDGSPSANAPAAEGKGADESAGDVGASPEPEGPEVSDPLASKGPSDASLPDPTLASPPATDGESTPAETESKDETPPAPPAAPEAPKFGDVKGEVSEFSDHLDADTLDHLRDAGCGLFLFLADLGQVDAGKLSQEAGARLANVRDRTQLLLAAIESVFVRHG